MTFPSFGIWKKRSPEEIDGWLAQVEDQQFSASEFYDAVEEALRSKEIPGLYMQRMEFSEGGALTARREYLRVQRERLVFDICSAPFGKGWFFSYHFAEIRFNLLVWELLVFLALLAAIVFGYIALFGPVFGAVFGACTLIGILLLIRNSLALGLYDLDAWLLRVPVIGAVYELLIRDNQTYHNQDTRSLFKSTVERVVQEKAEEIAATQGVKNLKFTSTTPDVHPVLSKFLRKLPQPA